MVLAEPLLVGREKELEILEHYLQSVLEGKGATVFVSAEAGTGKTRLINEFLIRSKKKIDFITLSGWCLFNAEVPYFPFIEAFSKYYSAVSRKSKKEEIRLNSFLREPSKSGFSQKLEYVSTQTLKDQTFSVVAETIHSIATQRPIILFIEDIHWADSASLALLHYIARAVNNTERILVLATFRSEELTSDPEGYPHKLNEALAMMKREDLFKRINLANLTTQNVTKLAESMLGGTLQNDLAEKIAVESEGNPLFIVESLRMLIEHKLLVQENNNWHMNTEQLGIPTKIRDIIMQRLACLNYNQRRILDAASVIGEKFDIGLLSAVVEQDNLDVLEALNMVANSTSLIRVDENQYRFDHAKSREILYEALDTPLKRGYHNRIGEKLENTGNLRELLSDLAYHFRKGGNKGKAIKYALAAAKDEFAKWSNEEAIKHFTYAINSIGDEAEGELLSEKETAMEGLGDAFDANGNFKEAIKIFEILADKTKSDLTKLRSLRKAMKSALEIGDFSYVLIIAKKSEPFSKADRLEYARILEIRGRAFFIQKIPSAAIQDFEAAYAIFKEEYSLLDLARSLLSGSIKAHTGQFEEGVANSLRAKAFFEDLGDHRWQMEAYEVAAVTFHHCLLDSEALDMYSRIIEIEEKFKIGNYLRLIYAYVFSSRFSFELRGDLDRALESNLKALEIAKKTDSVAALGAVYSNLIKEYTLMGDMSNAEVYFNKFINLPQGIIQHYYLQLVLTKAVFYAGKGKWEESNKLFEEWLEWVKGWPTPARLSLTKMFYAWALEKQGRCEEAKVQQEERRQIYQTLNDRFKHVNLQADLIAPARVILNQPFEARLELVNVSKRKSQIIKIENLIKPNLTLIDSSVDLTLKTHRVELGNKKLTPFEVRVIRVNLCAKHSGEIMLNPIVTYADDSGKFRQLVVKGSTIKIETIEPVSMKEIEKLSLQQQFERDATRRAFIFLVKAFLDDYMKNKLREDGSGWRTLMEVVKEGQLSRHNVYGRSGKGGRILGELKALSLIESSFFLGERGRGGRILRIRISVGQEKIKQLLDQLKKHR